MARTAGVDEAGRGPLAGPVVAAAVILPDGEFAGLADSKTLSESARRRLAGEIRIRAVAWALAVVSPGDIDRLNILQATMLGMQQAVARLAPQPGLVLVDGNRCPALVLPARAIVGGDASEPAISAASILAKVARDQLMVTLDEVHPGYGFAQHKGYPTAAHRAALERLGPCIAHRQSFAPVRRAMAARTALTGDRTLR
ncbi:ribonuclease HII [Spectribacter hydrogenoxidans]|uniref:Ribonuclease HII n=1 Tax=Spectribacter hydrogenoxidans TaxID=3075608 RepID=A0ABU3C1F1_9GAMM|nr:ribonuclease HII [Salinisphaera sp. W335]MDT0635378.1 ribonuclease HII [Salinisphaera sp. W335]